MRTLDELKKLQPEQMDLEELDYMVCVHKEICEDLGKTVGRLEISNQTLVQAGFNKVLPGNLLYLHDLHSKILRGLEREWKKQLGGED